MRLNNSIIKQSLSEYEQKVDVPAGYVEINLSTKGKVGAPASFHIRNFKVGELLSLSLSDTAELPARLINILNGMIYEDVDVSQFHEREVEELMVYVYKTFYSNTLEDIVFPIEDDDVKWLEENNPQLLQDIRDRKWTPRTTINITTDVDVYDIPDSFTSDITITNKSTGFKVTFGYIKYGDRLVVKSFLDDLYKEQEEKFAQFKKQINLNNSSITKTPLDPTLEKEYMDYVSERFEVLSDVSRLISIKDYNGVDVSELPLSEKYEIMANDARIDYGMIAKLSKRQNKTPIGIKPTIRMRNPITHQPCERRFSFRIPLIIQAIQVSGSDKYDDGFGDED